jgi:hypothetical protein
MSLIIESDKAWIESDKLAFRHYVTFVSQIKTKTWN